MSSRKREQQQRQHHQRQRAQEQQRARLQRWLIVGGAVVVVIAAVVAIVVSSGDDSKPAATATPQTRPVTVTGSSLPEFGGDSANDPAVGQPITSVSGADFAGAPVSIRANGKAKVLLFVAHWCPHCQREVPLLAPDLRANPLPAGVEMVTISTSVNADAPNYPPSKWLADVKWPTPVIADDENNSAAQGFGLGSFPYFVFVDRDNRVAARMSGELPLDKFRQQVSKLAPS